MTKSGRAFFALGTFALLFSSCTRSSSSLDEQQVFTLEYGNFEDEINLFDYTQVGNITTSLAMRDGFFYIANSEAGKVMELSSYGDLLTLYYSESLNPRPSFATEDGEEMNATRKAVPYPFNKTSDVTVDSKKNLYVVDRLPVERQELDEELGEYLSQIVLRFDANGNPLGYLGQQGPGGTPFPLIKKIYVTDERELVVVCVTGSGPRVFWFAENGYMLFTVRIDKKSIPVPYEDGEEYYMEIGNVVPDYSSRKLYINVDYSVPDIDESSRMQSGIKYDKTLLYSLNVESGTFGKSLTITPHVEQAAGEFSDTKYNIPYDFLGVSGSGWYFFMAVIDDGFEVQMIQNNGQIVLTRKIKADHRNTLYYTFNLSNTGVLSELVAKSDKVYILWWRTDSLIQSILKN